MPVNVVAKNIKKLRNAKDISQEDLAKTLNVTRQAISSWENGKTQPDIDMLMAISKALGVEMAELIYGEKPANEYDTFRKDRVKRSIILAVVFVALILINNIIGNYLNKQRIETFSAIGYILFKMFTLPLIYGTCGATILSFLAIWKDIRISSNKARKYLLVFGASIIWVYFIIYSLGIFETEAIALIIYWLSANHAIFIITGLCFLLGLNGEKTELKKSIVTISIITLCVIILFLLGILRPFS